MNGDPKTRSAADSRGRGIRHSYRQRLAAASALLALWAAQLACSGGYVSPAQLTATAGPGEAVAGLSLPGNPPTPFPEATEEIVTTPQVTQAAQPTDLPAPTDPPQEEPLPIVPTETPEPTISPTPKDSPTPAPPALYYTQAGDTLKGLAARFNVLTAEITSPEGHPIPAEGLFDPGVLLLIPQRLGDVSNTKPLIPDSEVVFSPSSLDFDISAFVKQAGGYLAEYREWRYNGWYDGAGVIRRVSVENSINPRMLLLILEQQSQWVYGQPSNLAHTDFPIGYIGQETDRRGLYFQLSWAVEQLNKGYYGWRDGSVTELTFPNGEKLRLAPDLNAGTVSLLYLFSRLYNQQEWAGVVYGTDGIMPRYEKMFGSPWLRAQSVEPLFPATLEQPPLALPFLPGHTWSFTGGPHSAWGQDQEQPRAAIDFAPSATVHGCYKSTEWATASAAGLVVRSGDGLVVLDLDGDGYEQTGWVLLYLHIASEDRVAQGAWVNQDEPIGHPSCEGGVANGTHVHMARKYNGEWILADGAMPFNLSGWRTHAEREAYKGSMTLGDQTVYSSVVGSYESRITRPLEPAASSR